MKEIYDKLNSHECLNYNDFRNFIYYYSKGKVKTKFIDMNNDLAYYQNLNNTIFINKKYRNEEIKHLIRFFKEEFKTVKEKNFLVDLYNLNGKIYFGELTFTHGAGLENFYPKKMDKIWGSYWKGE